MTRSVTTTCLIAGGGPAGVMTGLLLARAGVDVTVLEKHADFLRDFRGDTVHPSTMELLAELGLLERFLAVPHEKVTGIGIYLGGRFHRIADFTHLPGPAKFIALMPQWDFLEFVARSAARYPTFHLRRSTEVTDLLIEDGRVAGVQARDAEGDLTVRSTLVIGADGRHSRVRERAGLAVREQPAPIDVLWMRLPREASDPPQSFGWIAAGRMMVLLGRGDYWQCALLIQKGRFDEIRAQGLPAFRSGIGDLVPFLRGRTDSLEGWDDVKLLTVRVDRLERWWRPGLLCIGDAAHAMSPVGGVGINLAIQDAVAAANQLAQPLRERRVVDDALLNAVQERRTLPVKLVQRAQVLFHERVLAAVLRAEGHLPTPWLVKLFDRIALLRRIPARLVGLGVHREHIETAEVPP